MAEQAMSNVVHTLNEKAQKRFEQEIVSCSPFSIHICHLLPTSVNNNNNNNNNNHDNVYGKFQHA